MKTQIRPLITLFGVLALITGVLYPLTVTGLAQLIFPFQANGSLVKVDELVVGSELIGQDFSGEQFFWGRPSATSTHPYNAFDQDELTGSSGSNLGPLSQVLVDSVQERINMLVKVDPGNTNLIPVDLVTASASGLDANISVSAALYQVPRVARVRGLEEAAVTALVNQFTENRQFGLLGEPRVNVLLLNIALEGIK
ncbi:MAG TPA: potassium-transporting ATPase subunit C [Anaerolineaceae bacterium]|nr:potassium-transporting ATPase subunit C [Anaerolineaceae bacterium]